MHPHNVGRQLHPHLPEEIRNPEEYSGFMGKISRLAERHGEGYTVHTSRLPGGHTPGDQHSFWLKSPEGNWAGELTHDATTGNVGHFYVQKAHRVAIPTLVNHAINYALQNDSVPPQLGRDMTPKAEKLFRNQLPSTRSATNVALTNPIDTFGDQ